MFIHVNKRAPIYIVFNMIYFRSLFSKKTYFDRPLFTSGFKGGLAALVKIMVLYEIGQTSLI